MLRKLLWTLTWAGKQRQKCTTSPVETRTLCCDWPKNPVDAYENEVTLRYQRQEIGHWINGAPMAGDTFSWGPEGTGALAFTDQHGRLMLIDPSKRTLTAAGVKDARHPVAGPAGVPSTQVEAPARRPSRSGGAPVVAGNRTLG